MKQGIHPEYVDTVVTCTCGNSFHTRSTITSGEMRVDVCSACHPFYTGKQKILDTGGRVAKFEARYGKRVRPSVLIVFIVSRMQWASSIRARGRSGNDACQPGRAGLRCPSFRAARQSRPWLLPARASAPSAGHHRDAGG